MRLDIGTIVLDDFVYARNQKDSANTGILVEKLKAGIDLDAIEVQAVSGYGDDGGEAILLVNGGHRLEAYEEYNKLEGFEEKSASFSFYKEDEPLDYETYKSELAIRSHNSNDEQGLNSRVQDTKKIARNLALANPDWGQKDIADKLVRCPSTISDYVKDIFQQRRASMNRTVIRLSRLGWTQEAIGKVVGKDQSVVARIMQKFGAEDLHNSFTGGKSIDEIASYHDIDVQTAWGIILEGKPDLEKLKMLTDNIKGLNATPKPDDVWNFSGCMALTGREDYTGRIPGQIVLNTLYHFTDQGDVVIDPMAGGGTAIDACLLLSRKCFAYDIAPTRRDILQHDITQDPPDGKKADLIFLDPPYFKKKAKEYNLPEKYLTKKGFMEFASSWVVFCEARLKPGGYVALLISDYVDYEDPAGSIFSDEYARLFETGGYKRIYKVSCDLPTQQYEAHDVTDALEKRRLLIRGRELYILRRNRDG